MKLRFFLPAGFLLLTALFVRGAALDLPDPLVTSAGDRVASTGQWRQQRRPEILELFRQHIYGRAPAGRPQDLRFEVFDEAADAMEGKATRKQVRIHYTGPGGEGSMRLVLFIPNSVEPAPCFLLICNRGWENIDPTRTVKSPFWPAEEMIARGFAAAAFHYADVAPDNARTWTNGVIRLFPFQTADDGSRWGAVAAWAWGASRAMDYLEQDARIDKRRVAVVGHSRGGKTALWAGAEDERFAMVVSNDSGSTGAALARGKTGERIRDINRAFPHWFCANYKRYNDRENELPVDQHMLAALIAPRLLYVSSASEDAWADPKSEFLTAVHATPVFALLGVQGLETDRMPEPEHPLHAGAIGYHLRSGEHNLTLYDWARFMDFAAAHLFRR
ncbi:MAG: prolyl oligopeptidase family serine peptidase [Verrucomicrobiia bacterium]